MFSNASIACLFDRVASSQMISFASCNNLGKPDCLLIEHVTLSLLICSGILNKEWAVWTSSKIDVAIPNDVVASAIIYFERIATKRAIYR